MSPASSPARGGVPSWALTLLFALLYAAAVILGRAARIDDTPVAIAWPAAGTAVVWLMASQGRTPRRLVDVSLLFLLTVAGNRLTGAPMDLSLAFGVANTVQAAAACAILARLQRGRDDAWGLAGTTRLAVAAFAGAAVGAACGPITVEIVGAGPWPVDAAVWIFRNGASAFVLVAAAVAIRRSLTVGDRPAASRIEALAIVALAALATAVIFTDDAGTPLAFAVIPASVLVGARCSVVCAAVHGVNTWVIASVATLAGRGPFAHHTPDAQVILVQALVLGVALLTLVIAYTRHQERALAVELADEQAFVAALVGQLTTDLVICDAAGMLQRFDPECGRLMPLRSDLTPADWSAAFGLHTADGSRPLEPSEAPLYRALQGETVEATELLVRRPDGTTAITLVTATPFRDAAGERRGAVARVVDVTDLRTAEAEARARADELAAIGRVAHQLASETDLRAARSTICEAARAAAQADFCVLFEPTPNGRQLAATASHGEDRAVEFAISFTGPPSAAVRAFTTGTSQFASEAASTPGLSTRLIESTGMVSGLWQPVVKDGTAVGVLVLGWRARLDALSPYAAEAVELIAAEAALALDRAALISQLDEISRTDPLTGAHNRRSLTERLGVDLHATGAAGQPLSLVMADVDYFKRYNDDHGHIQGDRLLKALVGSWTQELRPTDTIARYGGEEFAIVLPNCDARTATILAERLRAAVPYGQTASFGVVERAAGETAEAMIARADASLYEAKHAGRDRVVTRAGTTPRLHRPRPGTWSSEAA